MNYNAVAPPDENSGANNASFQDALARARQIAAKIGQGDSAGTKRPYEDFSDSPEPKKFAVNQTMNVPSNQSSAAAAAAAAAAAINAKLGITNTNPPPQIAPPGQFKPETFQVPDRMVGLNMGGSLVNVRTESIGVPDSMVGLVIGKGGEQIAAIQAETGVKVQFAQDSGGQPERPCTLTGPPDGILRAKEIINKIIAKGSGLPDLMGSEAHMVEIMVPGHKVGLVIGKGGETIKQLQERAGVKMVMIQDSNIPSQDEKPLRITGEPNKCKYAKELVQELIAQKDHEGFGAYGEYGQGSRTSQEIQVPRSVVGVIIGKQGDMIKRIQADTMAKVQFTPDDGSQPERTCLITGTDKAVHDAMDHVKELVAAALNRQSGMFAGFGLPGLGPRQRNRGNRDFEGGYGVDESTFDVPADKCGLIIGKGGESIKQIAQQSGARVELSRGPDPAPGMKSFSLRGSQQSIEEAINLIKERIDPGRGGGGGGYYDQQYGGQQGQQNYAQEWSQYWQNQHGAGNQNEKQSQDANAAAWAAYYQQQQQQQQQQQPQPPTSAGQNGQQPPGPPATNPQTGQPDYSLQWAEYYRSQGMHYHAQAILAQAGHGPAPAPPQQPPQSQPQGPPGT